MQKLIFINRFFYPDISATSQLLSDLVFTLSEDEFKIEVLCSRLLYTDNNAEPLPLNENINNIQVHRLRSSQLGKKRPIYRLFDYLTFYISVCWYLLKNLTRNTVVVTKTDPPLLSIPISLIAKLKRAKVINWYQDVFPEVAQAAGITIGNKWTTTIIMGAIRLLRNISLKQSMANVVLSESMREHMISCGIQENSLHIIPNWSNLSDIHPISAEHSKFRDTWNLKGQFVVGYSGNLGVAHEFETMIGAADVLRNNPNITFLIIGSGQRRNAAIEAVRLLKLENKVIFKPYQPRESLGQSLAVADVHLISLRPAMEGLIVPSKFYGIAAAARPSIYIGNTNSEMARLLQSEQCGCSVAINDSETLANQIIAYSHDEQRIKNEGNNALALSRNHYTLSQAKEAWKSLLLSGLTTVSNTDRTMTETSE